MSVTTRPARKGIASPASYRTNRWTGAFLKHLILLVGTAVMVLPFIWMFATSFKPPTEVLIWPPKLLPEAPTWQNYRSVFSAIPLLRYFANSIFISVVSTILILISSLAAGYVFSKFQFPGRNFLFLLILATAIVPFESYMVPYYLQMVDLGWIDTYQGIISPYVLMSFGIFLMRQHIGSSVPDDLIASARIDGASEWTIFQKIVTPLSSSAVGALGIFAFMQAWSAFIWPLLMASSKNLFNMELGLTAFQFRFSVDYGPLMAGSVMNILPMIVIFILLRRRIIDSVALSGLKG